jgi:hypothetical protein
MITIKNQKIERLIDEILKRTPYSSAVEYLEARITADHKSALKNKKIP